MNAHSSRRTPRHRNFSPAFILLLFSLVAAGTARPSAGRAAQLPPGFAGQTEEDVKKEFNDDDLKMKAERPRGKWMMTFEFDMDQFQDNSMPAAIGAVQSLSGGGKYTGVTKIKRMVIKNRSPKIINSVQIRWEIVSLDNPAKVLSEGATMFVNTWVEANSSQVIEIPVLYPALLLKPLAKDGVLYGRFQITLGLQEIRFADGSFWRRQERAASLKFINLAPPSLCERRPA